MTGNHRSFYLATVKPTVDEFLATCMDVRRGRLASIVLFHMADYWALECEIELWKARGDIVQQCPDFALIRDIANASKHDRLNWRQDPPVQLSRSEQVTRPPGLFQAPFGEGVFAEASLVTISLDDGSSRPLADVIRSVSAVWEQRLQLDR